MRKELHQLNQIELEILQTFNYELSEEDLSEVRNIFAKYFAAKATEEMDKIWIERGWTNATMEEFLKEHMRTPYK